MRRVFPFWMATVTAAWGATADAATVTAKLSAQSATPGEQVRLTVTVRDGEEVELPQVPRVEGLTIRLLTPRPMETSSMQIINGRVRKWVERTWEYAVVPGRAGRLTIPPIRIVVDGREMTTDPQTLVVARSESGEYLLVEIEVDREEVFVEEPVQALLRVWIRVYRQSGVTLDPEQMWSLVDENDSSFGPFGKPQFAERQIREDEDGGAATYYVYERRGTLWPEQAGTMNVSDVRIVMNYPRWLARDLFGSLSVQSSRRLAATPGAVRLRVRAVPEEGRPPDFNGAVGRYTISAGAKPVDVRVGDPITLTLTVRGTGRLERVAAPRLTEVAELVRDFRVPAESLAGRVEGNAKTFTQTIRATHAGVKEIPAIPMSYFDPKTRRFQTTYSEPIPLHVTESNRMSLEQVVESEPGRPKAGATLIERTEGLLANYVDMNAVLADQRLSFSWGWGATAAICPLGYFCAALMRRRSVRWREDAAFRRRSRAAVEARRLLREAGSHDGAAARVGDALCNYIADRTDAPPGALTREEARRLLAGRDVPADLVDEVDSILADVEMAEFGGVGADASALAGRAKRCLDRLERLGLE